MRDTCTAATNCPRFLKPDDAVARFVPGGSSAESLEARAEFLVRRCETVNVFAEEFVVTFSVELLVEFLVTVLEALFVAFFVEERMGAFEPRAEADDLRGETGALGFTVGAFTRAADGALTFGPDTAPAAGFVTGGLPRP